MYVCVRMSCVHMYVYVCICWVCMYVCVCHVCAYTRVCWLPSNQSVHVSERVIDYNKLSNVYCLHVHMHTHV